MGGSIYVLFHLQEDLVIEQLSPAEITTQYRPPGDSPVTTIVDNYQVHCRRRAGRLETIPCRR